MCAFWSISHRHADIRVALNLHSRAALSMFLLRPHFLSEIRLIHVEVLNAAAPREGDAAE